MICPLLPISPQLRPDQDGEAFVVNACLSNINKLTDNLSYRESSLPLASAVEGEGTYNRFTDKRRFDIPRSLERFLYFARRTDGRALVRFIDYTSSAGINRHVVRDERALQERRTANPSWPRVLRATR